MSDVTDTEGEPVVVSPKNRVSHFLWGLSWALVVSLTIATTWLTTSTWVSNTQFQKEQRALEEMSFEDFMVYYRFYPAEKYNRHGALVYNKSDFEILRIPSNGMLQVTWRERMACDRNPYDKDVRPVSLYRKYTPYKSATTVSFIYTEVVPRLSPAEQAKRKKFSMQVAGTNKLMRYPEVDSDCIVISTVTLTLPYGVEKTLLLIGEPAHVHLNTGPHAGDLP